MANQTSTNFNTTKNGSIFLVELEPPFERLEFQFVPQEVSTNRRGKVRPIEVVARNNDFHQLTGGEDVVTFELDFYSPDMELESVIEKVNWLKSLSMIPQRNVRLVWGDLFQNEVFIIEQVNARYRHFRPNFDMNPQQAYAQISMRVNNEENITIDDMRGGGIESGAVVRESTIGFL